MATVSVQVNGRTYPVGCADGQEQRVTALAGRFDAEVRKVAAEVGQVGEIRLFLMAALILADQLAEADARVLNATAALPSSAGDGDARAAEALNRAADAIEKLTAGL
ncbi:cell division protein ZapA [Brevundimonas sp. 2R-24]|uniref:Cell division protein ZapA n=1 Tax=Peiella sedimenti TaxID=3061083 RepID=A0ABT8SHJ6_9CAUL|nr:cell division protein ZapA [Caulobacteraceae bacterium XZ-24]